MNPDPTELFVRVLSSASAVPEVLRLHAHEACGVEERAFDETYIAFLDEQIGLSPRGPEWTARLRRRRAGLVRYCSIRMVRGRVRAGTSDFTVYIDPRVNAVAYWEEYPI
jgi:hypothetical protein